MSTDQKCLEIIRAVYQEFDSLEIAECIKIVRAELTKEEHRNELQIAILAKQAELDKLNFNNKT